MKAYGRGEEPEIAAVKNPPAHGAWNVQIVATGNWGGPPRPGDLRVCHRKVECLTGSTGKWMSCRVGVEGGQVLLEPSGQHNRR